MDWLNHVQVLFHHFGDRFSLFGVNSGAGFDSPLKLSQPLVDGLQSCFLTIAQVMPVDGLSINNVVPVLSMAT